jgi:hypothetical protein
LLPSAQAADRGLLGVPEYGPTQKPCDGKRGAHRLVACQVFAVGLVTVVPVACQRPVPTVARKPPFVGCQVFWVGLLIAPEVGETQ